MLTKWEFSLRPSSCYHIRSEVPGTESWKFIHNAMQDVVQDLVFEAKKIDYCDLAQKFADKFGDEPRVFLRKSREFNTALPHWWFPFLSSIPTIETDNFFRQIQPLYDNEDANDSQSESSSSEDDEHLNEAHNAWLTASKNLFSVVGRTRPNLNLLGMAWK